MIVNGRDTHQKEYEEEQQPKDYQCLSECEFRQEAGIMEASSNVLSIKGRHAEGNGGALSSRDDDETVCQP